MLSFHLPTSSHARLSPLPINCNLPAQTSSKDDEAAVLFQTFNPKTCRPLDCANSLSPLGAFISSQSRVLRLHNFRSLSASVVVALLHQEGSSPSPMTVWALRDDYKSNDHGRFLYCMYRTHEEAAVTLSLPPSPLFSLAPALEPDLEPFHKLRRVDFKQLVSTPTFTGAGDTPVSPHYISSPVNSLPPPSPCKLDRMSTIRQSSSFSDFREPIRLSRASSAALSGGSVPARPAFPISSNPPNAKTNFRLGDWICKSPICGAHNFGRNVACIGCGSPRPTDIPGYFGQTQLGLIQPPKFPSPRFASVGSPYVSPLDAFECAVPQRRLLSVPVPEPSKSTSPYPVLTPSGRQLSVGGKVQNISTNPLAPCFMFWSYNEPLPHPGQIRPTILASLQHPPILNTGNRGPIEHQPGDWICQKCNYLNWRRRKVCQTCFPYAEGNGDSISTAVQAERIALLADVLSSDSPAVSTLSGRDSHSLPPSPTLSLIPTSSLTVAAVQNCNLPLSRSRSHANLFQNHHGVEQPIYQTSSGVGYLSTPAPLLPSFLQDMVHSPTLSPASSVSADFSLEDYDDVELSQSPRRSHPLGRKPSSSLTGYSIWKLDGDEARALSGQSQEDL